MTNCAATDAVDTVRAAIAAGIVIRVDDAGRRLLFKSSDSAPKILQSDLCSRKWAIIAYLETTSGWVDSWLSSLRDPVWFEEWRTHFHECAAVREHECGNTREDGERIALVDLEKQIIPWAEGVLRKMRDVNIAKSAGPCVAR